EEVEGRHAASRGVGSGHPRGADVAGVVARERVVADPAARAPGQLADLRAARPRDEHAVLRQPIDEALERRDVARLVRVDVDVVVLDRGEDRALGPVLPELRALLEEGAVVLVALHDEEAAFVTEPEALVEVARDA